MTPTENNRCRIWLLAGLVAILLLPWFSNFSQGQHTPEHVKSQKVPHLDLPEFGAIPGSNSGRYTGYNSLNLQEIYVVEKRAAVRSQIARGWGKPIIVRLRNGDLLASAFKSIPAGSNPQHPSAVYEAALCRSKDQGFSWSAPRLLGIPARVVQFSALRTGTLIMATGYGEYTALYRSQDEGETWKRCVVVWKGVPDKPGHSSLLFEETSGVLELRDGTLICNGAVVEGRGGTSYLLRSRDDGRTWEDASVVPTGTPAVEISYVELPDGKLLGFARVQTDGLGEGGAALKIIESTDGGRRWTPPRSFGLGKAQIPGFPLYLKDGRLVLVYGHRQFPFGVQAIASRDGGKSWDTDHSLILSWFSWDASCGIPRSLVMPDGSIMTGYYTRVFNAGSSEDVVSHALSWRVPDHWPPERK
ncbi:MAG: exo-alpha-sialidase [Acidimicrobiia bacterium]|nr:exo-alpha-sialidase [Acidimicrobiia bacterium]